MRRFRRAVGLGIAIAAIGMAVRATAAGEWLEEDLALRWLFTVRGPVDAPPGVAIVSIDKTSSDQLGLNTEEWPPPRHVHASVVRALKRHAASAVVIDVFFRSRRTPAEDDDLAAAIQESGRVALFERVERLQYSGGDIVQLRSPIEPLRRAALATAAFPLPDSTPVSFFWTFFDATSAQVPTLPAVALQIHALPYIDRLLSVLRDAGVTNLSDVPSRFAGVEDFRQVMTVLRRELRGDAEAAGRALAWLERDAGHGMTAGERSVLAALVRLYSGSDTCLLNYYGPPGRIRTIPFHELLADGSHPRFDLNGVVVFVGEAASEISTSDQRDTYRTVYSENGVDLSGAEIAATAFANLLANRTLQRVHPRGEVGILVCFALLAAVLARVLPALYGAGTILLLACAYFGIAQYLFTTRAAIVPVGIPLVVQVPVTLFAALWSRYRDVRRQVVVEVDPEAVPDVLQGVCLSTDIENYVAVSAGLPPRDLALLMGQYYDMLAALVARRRGLMMGRAGDSAMCVWAERTPQAVTRLFRARASRQRAADRRRADACHAALEIREAVARFNEQHVPPLRTRIGLHAGQIALGPVGGEYHVMGDVPNTASRIESLNKQLGTTILASAAVVRDQPDLCLRPVGRFVLAGRSDDLEIVEILGRRAAVDEAIGQLVPRFAGALAAFDAGDLAEAARLFRAIASDYPSDGPARFYHHLCADPGAFARTETVPKAIRMHMK